MGMAWDWHLEGVLVSWQTRPGPSAWAPSLEDPTRGWRSPHVHHRLSELAGTCDIIKTDPATSFRLILYATERRALGTQERLQMAQSCPSS